MTTPKTLAEVAEALRAPFPSVKYRTGATWAANGGRRGKALPYIDARDVEERLDEVVGPDGWETRIAPCNVPGAYICELTILGVTKSSIGQAGADEGEKEKSADSDAFKRAAVRFGIGRYLYSLPDYVVDLVEVKEGKWDLPRGWSPEAQAAARSSGSSSRPAVAERPASTSAPAPSSTPAGPKGLRAPGRYKLFDNKVKAVFAKGRDAGLEREEVIALVQTTYGSPTVEDLTGDEFRNIMDVVFSDMIISRGQAAS